jgi:hypothetical protein
MWREWYAFTLELAVNSSFTDDETEKTMARSITGLIVFEWKSKL